LLAYALGGGLGGAFAAAVVAGFGFLAFDPRRYQRRLAGADAIERERIVARTEQDAVTSAKAAMAVIFLGFPAVMIVVLVVWGVVTVVH
jgi:hypothetical protein